MTPQLPACPDIQPITTWADITCPHPLPSRPFFCRYYPTCPAGTADGRSLPFPHSHPTHHFPIPQPCALYTTTFPGSRTVLPWTCARHAYHALCFLPGLPCLHLPNPPPPAFPPSPQTPQEGQLDGMGVLRIGDFYVEVGWWWGTLCHLPFSCLISCAQAELHFSSQKASNLFALQ